MDKEFEKDNNDIKMLQGLYSVIREGQNNIMCYMPCEKTPELRECFHRHMDEYMEIKNEVVNMIESAGERPIEINTKKAASWSEMEVGTLMEFDVKSVLERMVAGSYRCVSGMNRLTESFPVADIRIKNLMGHIKVIERNYVAELSGYCAKIGG